MTSFHRITFAILVLAAAGCKDMGTEPQTARSTGTASGRSGLLLTARSSHLQALRLYRMPRRQRQVSSWERSRNCSPVVLMVLRSLPDRRTTAILIKKLSAAPPFGSRMPQGGPNLPDSTVTVLRNWINQGALNN